MLYECLVGGVIDKWPNVVSAAVERMLDGSDFPAQTILRFWESMSTNTVM